MATNRFFYVLALLLLVFRASAFEQGGIAYEVISGTDVKVVEHWPIYVGDIVIPPSVVHDGVTYQVKGIDRAAFANAADVTSIQLPEGLVSIGAEAFKGCYSLRNIVVPNSVTEIGIRAFYACTNLQQLMLGTGITTIPYGMCMGCLSLSAIDIPDQVVTVGSYAFNSTPITQVTIGLGVREIGVYAFEGCRKLTLVNVKDLAQWCNFDFYSIEFNPLYYARQMALNGERLTSLTIPEGVETIKPYAFANCLITEITLPQSLKTFHILGISRANFNSLTLPDSVTAIIPQGIETPYISALRSLTIGRGVKVLAPNTFYRANNLAQITLNEGLEELYDYVFASLPITEIVLPNSVTTISNAFNDCTRLQSITLGSGLKHLDHGSFSGCSKISEVHVLVRDPWQIDLSGEGQFGDSQTVSTNKGLDKSTCVLYVPMGSAELYRAHPFWSAFTNIEEEGLVLPGDVDGNGVVDIDDLNQIINKMINKPVGDSFIPEAADTNGDGMVDIDDVNYVINKIVRKI